MCGICGTTGPLILNNQPQVDKGFIGGSNTSGGLVPQIVRESQVIVTGAPQTGPRKTVVDTANPASWPAWISAVGGKPVDNGNPGGTYQPQQLPDLVTTAKRHAPMLLAVALIIGVLWVATRK